MTTDTLILTGRDIRLEPLRASHAAALAEASAVDPSIYQWSPIPQGEAAAAAYIDAALGSQQAGTAVPFVIVRTLDDAVIGSTRFFNLENWKWPDGHERYRRGAPDVCEIGYTWFTASAIRTRANTETKFLMLRHAFEEWGVVGVCLHTDLRNVRSQAAMERMGAKRDGVLRAHRLAVDYIPRDSVRYSIIVAEWPEVRSRLLGYLAR